LLSGLYILNEKTNAKLDRLELKVDKRSDALDEKLTDVDRRLCRLEGAFASKDCCMIKESSAIKKAE
jgi:hypothetical protein